MVSDPGNFFHLLLKSSVKKVGVRVPFSSIPLSYLLMGAVFSGTISAYLFYRVKKRPLHGFLIGFLFGVYGLAWILITSWPSLKKRGGGRRIPQQLRPAFPLPQEKTLQGPSDKFWYYLNEAHEQQGPMSLTALSGAWKEGKVSLSTYVWHEDLPEWKKLGEFVIQQS